jgi:hypothetical protein
MIPRIVGTLAAVVLVGLGTVHCYWAAGPMGDRRHDPEARG